MLALEATTRIVSLQAKKNVCIHPEQFPQELENFCKDKRGSFYKIKKFCKNVKRLFIYL